MLFAPEVSVPSMREFSETEEILVDCNVTANPPAHSIVWTKEGDASFRQVKPFFLIIFCESKKNNRVNHK